MRSVEAALDFFGGELFCLRGDHPDVAEGIGELAGALAVELILHRVEHFGAGSEGARGDCVHVIYLEVDLHG